MLIEEQRTNLVTYSEDFGNAVWSKGGATVTANTIVAPDGTLTSDKLVENTANSVHYVLQPVNLLASTTYTVTVYVKAGERTFIALQPLGLSDVVYYNLTTGTIATVTGAPNSFSITPVGNGWYRCVVSSTTSVAGLYSSYLYLASADSVPTYTGDGYSGIYIWGAQIEAGAFPTSYIPTVASQVTRSADSASMTGANFSEWYAGGKGTVYSESAVYASNIKTQFVWDLSGGATSTSLRSPQATTARLRALVGGTFTGAGTGAVIANNTFIKATVAWDGLNGRLQSGSVGENVTALANLDANAFGIGTTVIPGNYLNGHIKRLSYYPARLTNTQLQALTS